MKTLLIKWDGLTLDFNRAKKLADAAAEKLVEEPILLSWYDRPRDLESPRGVNECHRSCNVPGYVEYAMSRGGVLIVDVADGAYVFCYRPLGEFA